MGSVTTIHTPSADFVVRLYECVYNIYSQEVTVPRIIVPDESAGFSPAVGHHVVVCFGNEYYDALVLRHIPHAETPSFPHLPDSNFFIPVRPGLLTVIYAEDSDYLVSVESPVDVDLGTSYTEDGKITVIGRNDLCRPMLGRLMTVFFGTRCFLVRVLKRLVNSDIDARVVRPRVEAGPQRMPPVEEHLSEEDMPLLSDPRADHRPVHTEHSRPFPADIPVSSDSSVGYSSPSTRNQNTHHSEFTPESRPLSFAPNRSSFTDVHPDPNMFGTPAGARTHTQGVHANIHHVHPNVPHNGTPIPPGLSPGGDSLSDVGRMTNFGTSSPDLPGSAVDAHHRYVHLEVDYTGYPIVPSTSNSPSSPPAVNPRRNDTVHAPRPMGARLPAILRRINTSLPSTPVHGGPPPNIHTSNPSQQQQSATGHTGGRRGWHSNRGPAASSSSTSRGGHHHPLFWHNRRETSSQEWAGPPHLQAPLQVHPGGEGIWRPPQVMPFSPPPERRE